MNMKSKKLSRIPHADLCLLFHSFLKCVIRLAHRAERSKFWVWAQGTTCEAYDGLKSPKDFWPPVSFFSTATMVSCRAILLLVSIITLALSESDRKERFCNLTLFLNILASILTLYFFVFQCLYSTLSSFPMMPAMLDPKTEPVTQSKYLL